MTVFLLLYWVLMIVWFFGFAWSNWGNMANLGSGLVQWVLFLLLGIRVFPIPLGA